MGRMDPLVSLSPVRLTKEMFAIFWGVSLIVLKNTAIPLLKRGENEKKSQSQ